MGCCRKGISQKNSTEHGRGLISEVSFLEANDDKIVFPETSRVRPLPMNIIDITLRE